MFSVTSIIGLLLGGVLAYFLWKMLKTVLIAIGVLAVIAGALYGWAHTETSATATLPQDETASNQGMVEHGARWLARPIHDVAQQVVELTQDETQFVKKVEIFHRDESMAAKSRGSQNENTRTSVDPSQGGLSHKAEPSPRVFTLKTHFIPRHFYGKI